MLDIEENIEDLKFLVSSLNTLVNYNNENLINDCYIFCKLAKDKLETISRILEKK